MKLLLDTHLLLRAAARPKRLSRTARRIIEGITLLTSDTAVAAYRGPIRKV